MAGFGERFRAAGYQQEKFRLAHCGEPILYWVLLSFARYFDSAHFVLVARRQQGIENWVQSVCHRLGIHSSEVVSLEQRTRGQAETVRQGLINAQTEPSVGPLFIFNIDTIRPYVTLPRLDSGGWLETFRGAGDGWSFVMPSATEKGTAEFCTEKERVSELCSTGLYGFADFELFSEAYLAHTRKPESGRELYVAPLFNEVIRAGHRVRWNWVPDDEQVILSGNPREYESLPGCEVFAQWKESVRL